MLAMISFQNIISLETHGSGNGRLDSLHRENLPAVSVCPNFADTFKTCSAELKENGKEFHVLPAVCVLPINRAKRNYRFNTGAWNIMRVNFTLPPVKIYH